MDGSGRCVARTLEARHILADPSFILSSSDTALSSEVITQGPATRKYRTEPT